MTKRPTDGPAPVAKLRARQKAAKKLVCDDCGTELVNGGSVGYYCPKPGCEMAAARRDMRIDRIHLHDKPEDTPQFKEDLTFEVAMVDQLVVMQVAYPTTWACQETRMSMLDLQRLLRLIDLYRLRADSCAKNLSDLCKSELTKLGKGKP